MIYLLKIKLCITLVMCGFAFNVVAQDEDDTGKLPVRSPFETGMLIDNPTIVNPLKGALELNIIHRFGLIDNGTTDLFGIYAPSNIKMALSYGVMDRVTIGLGTTKDNKLQDLNWKVALLRQNRNGSVPLSISYFGNFTVDARSKESFGPADRYREIHRFSYFTQFIFARKFNEMVSFQVAPSMSYFNAIDTGYQHVIFGVSVGGRAKIFSSSSILFEYDHSLTQHDIIEVKPNLGIGYEIGTATHAFQIFVSNFRGIVPQYNYAFNTNDLSKGKFVFGFNITVRL